VNKRIQHNQKVAWKLSLFGDIATLVLQFNNFIKSSLVNCYLPGSGSTELDLDDSLLVLLMFRYEVSRLMSYKQISRIGNRIWMPPRQFITSFTSWQTIWLWRYYVSNLIDSYC
jgi:hypothetical protein